jgi:L-malate glycosyltransferase
VTTLHGTDITIVGQDPSFRPITKFSIEKSDGLTAVSRYLQTETLTTFGCTACRIEVIHNFIDPEVYDRSRYTSVLDEQIDSNTHVLMHISNFRAVKRVKDVVRIFARVAARLPSVLVMVGDGPDRGEAEAEARELGLQDKVFFLGKIDAVAPLLAGADLFLLPSTSESFGLSALEALACGVPVIGTKAGGLPEVVRDGETGVLCGVGDVDAMSNAAIEILSDRDRWRAMSRLAAVDARERFSLDAIVAEYEAFYEYALARPSTTERRIAPAQTIAQETR